MTMHKPRQDRAGRSGGPEQVQFESVNRYPKLKLLDQMREVMRLKHYSIRTERSTNATQVLRQGGAGMKSPLDSLGGD